LPKIALPVSTANPVTFAPGHARLATNPQYRLRSVARFRVARRCEPIQGKSAAYKPIPITPRNTGATRRFIRRGSPWRDQASEEKARRREPAGFGGADET
jgi:hypothetical protein